MRRAYQSRASSAESALPSRQPVPERLLAAAMELVQTEGLQALSQARVAAAAGLRQSHLTYYFPTRKDLIKALVQAIHAEIAAEMQAAVLPDVQGAAAQDKVRAFFAARISEPLMARLMTALHSAADEDPSLRRWLGDFDNDIIDRLRDVFAALDLRPSDDELWLLHASFIGAAMLGAQPGTDAGPARAAHLARLAFDRLVAASPRARGANRPSRQR